ncbi:hypothetical protein VTK73DRAFT_3431 [Phialemonium thermophilum]|uniref:Uncharacterized protein n=1 Tax=Phialemonium thermophilum TaxID=223376 RepID=A0ABR3WZM9_9PEZI
MLETPVQYERDLRSASKEWKRSKDSTTKWSFGSRPLSGCHLDLSTYETVGGSESQRAKSRPRGKASDVLKTTNLKKEHNIIKTTRGNYEMPAGRVRAKTNAYDEISDVRSSFTDGLPAPGSLTRKMTASDNFLYSFDRTESPGRPLTLDIFLKPSTPRDTERLVEKEYEILDDNGQALKGRKARRILRKGTAAEPLGKDEAPTEDEGFELV